MRAFGDGLVWCVLLSSLNILIQLTWHAIKGIRQEKSMPAIHLTTNHHGVLPTPMILIRHHDTPRGNADKNPVTTMIGSLETILLAQPDATPEMSLLNAANTMYGLSAAPPR